VNINRAVIVAGVKNEIVVLDGDIVVVKAKKADDDVPIGRVKVGVEIVVIVVVGNVVGNIVESVARKFEGIRIIDLVEVRVKKDEDKKNVDDVLVEKEKIRISDGVFLERKLLQKNI
jgi:hypothetical protein